MQFTVLATDYDGTLAHHGDVDDATYAALERFRASGRKLVLVTGRVLAELQDVFPRLGIFDMVVAENGPVLFDPKTGEERLLATPPRDDFVLALRHAGATPLDVGRVVVATREPYDEAVHEAIRDMGLELQVIYNKGAVMVLPPGINKGIGLSAALVELGATPEQVVAVGDAENDHSLLKLSGFAAAVANALPALKERADYVLRERASAGVVELIEMILADDLAAFAHLVKDRVSDGPVTVVAASVEAVEGTDGT